jgi:hypothetical protein
MKTQIVVSLPENLVKMISLLSQNAGESFDEFFIYLLGLALSHESEQPTLEASGSPERENADL